MLNFMPIVYKQVKMVIIELRKPCVDVFDYVMKEN